jgi:Family of unknown function (DUF6193)
MNESVRTLYPDLDAVGGLSSAISVYLKTRFNDPERAIIFERQRETWATLKKGPRFIQMTIASNCRLFVASIWHKGRRLGGLTSVQLEEITGACADILLGESSVVALQERYPALDPTTWEEHHELSAEEEVAAEWEAVKDAARTEWPDLMPLVEKLVKQSPFNGLFPFFSINALCLSNKTTYPYVGEYPVVVGVAPNTFEIKTIKGVSFGRRNLNEALELLNVLIRENSGPATQHEY